MRSSDGRTYYHNARSNETAWQRPAEMDPPPAAAAAAAPSERRRQRRFDSVDSHPAPSHGGDSHPSRTGSDHPGRTGSDAHAFLSSLDPVASAPMPPPSEWREVRSSDGRTYYHSSRTNETVWQRPAEMDLPPPQQQQQQQQQQPELEGGRRRRRVPGDEAAEPPQAADRRYPPSSYPAAAPQPAPYPPLQPAYPERDRYGHAVEPPRDPYGQSDRREPPRTPYGQPDVQTDRYGQPTEPPPRDRYGQPD